MVTADINGDQKVDIIVRNQSDQNMMIFFNSGNGTFTRADITSGLNFPSVVILADMNIDDKLDIMKKLF